MRTPTGIVIIDTNCLKHLESPNERRLLASSLTAADFVLYPTATNAVEAAQNESPAIQKRALAVVRALARDKGLLPFPRQILQSATDAIRNGQNHFFVPPLLLKDHAFITPDERLRARTWTADVETRFSQLHSRVRVKAQALIKKKPDQAPWTNIPNFLDQFWTTVKQQDTLLQGLWESFGYGGQAPIEEMIVDPTWRMFLDLEGVAVFDRVIVQKERKRVQHADLLQLLYLTLCPRRVLVTDDQPFLCAAGKVLHGRYSQAEVLAWDDFRRSV